MTKKKATVEDVRKILREFDPDDPEADKRDSAVLLLSATIVGAKERLLVDFTGIPRARVREVLRRGREQGVFTPDGGLRVEWGPGGPEERDGIAFICDVLVLDGMFARA